MAPTTAERAIHFGDSDLCMKSKRRVLMSKLCLAVIACMIGYSNVAVAVEAMEFACWNDYYKYCPAVEPGGGRIVACLSKQKITSACRQSMKAWLALNKWAVPRG
jgi:cysteine rich repeat protein